MFDNRFGSFSNFRRRDSHALLEVPHVLFFSVNLEYLTIGHCELLILSVFHSKNDGLRRGHMPYFAGDGLHRSDRPRGCRRGDCALKFHSGLELMNSDFSAID